MQQLTDRTIRRDRRLRQARRIILTLSVALGTEPASATPTWEQIPNATVELHAHLFMKDGLGLLFRGVFDTPLKASKWTDRFSSQANPESLERSGIRILVVSIYAHPFFSRAQRLSVRRQIAQARSFIADHRDWVIVGTASEARRALDLGKRVMVLSLEGAEGILENDWDLVELIDQKGIRIVNLVHLTDDEVGGVALMRGAKSLFSPTAFVSQRFCPHGEGGVPTNRRGLTERGMRLARDLIPRGVWLDLTHMSDASQRDLIPMLEKAGQPVLYTHTVLRSYDPEERALASWQLDAVKRTGGIVGVMPVEDMLEQTPATCPPECSQPCRGGLGALVTQYREIAARIGPDSVMMGSDYNGGVTHLRPSCGTGTSLDRTGLWNIGQVGELWRAMGIAGAPVPDPLSAMVTRFLDAWERVVPIWRRSAEP